MSYLQLGEVTATVTGSAGSAEAARRAVLDPIVAEYRDRQAVNISGRLAAAESVLENSEMTNHAVLAATSPTTFWSGAPAVLTSAIQAVSLAKSDAEKAKADFTKAYLAVVPKNPSDLNLDIPSEWEIKNTLDAIDASIVKAASDLTYWQWSGRDSESFLDTARRAYDKVIPNEDGLKKFLYAAAAVYIVGQFIGRSR